MDDLYPLNVALSARPARGVVLVPKVTGIDWRVLFRLAVRCQNSAWGGAGNLLLPMPPGDAAEDELFWRLVDAQDADAFLVQDITAADLSLLAPDEYQRRHTEAQTALAEVFDEPELGSQVSENLARQRMTGVQIPTELQQLLVSRVVPLSHDGQLPLFGGTSADPPGWPFVPVEKLRPLPDELWVVPDWPDENRALMGALVRGDISTRLRDALAGAGVTISPATGVAGERPNPVRSWSTAVEDRFQKSPRQISLLGLGQYSRAGAPLPEPVICIGDDAWDFAFAYALERMGPGARWVPASAASDQLALHVLTTFIMQARQRYGSTVHVCSVSNGDAAAALKVAVEAHGQGLQLHLAEPLDLVPRSPARLYERDRIGFSQAVMVHGGRTPALPTPIPRNVEAETPDQMTWMTDVSVEDWVSLRHSGLAAAVLDHPFPDMVRCGRDGVAYLGPGAMAFRAIALETQAVRPKLSPLSLLEQVQAVLSAAGWRAELSDKGIYAQQSLDIFGGLGGLLTALGEDRARLLTVFTVDDADAPGWKLSDSRRYLTFEELDAVTRGPDSVIVELEAAGALNRGLVLACSRCRAKSFYFLTDVGDAFTCTRCKLNQPLTQASWMVGNEPPWRYGLAEVLFQFLRHDGDLPLLAAERLRQDISAGRTLGDQRMAPFASEVDVFSPDGARSELDIVIADGHELWVGEATGAPRLETTNASELLRLERLRAVADVLSARGVLLVNGGSWNRGTIGRANAVFPGIWPRLVVIEHAARAARWTATAGAD